MRLILLSFLSLSFLNSKALLANFSNLETAFIEIAEFLSESDREISVISYGSNATSINMLIKSLKLGKFPYKLLSLRTNASISFRLRESAVLSFDSMSSLTTFNKNSVLVNKFPKNLSFFVFCQNSTFEEISLLIDTEILQYQYFLVEEESSVRLLTFVWYTAAKCNSTQLLEVNSFNKTTQKWKNSNFKIDKFNNFHGCLLVFGHSVQAPAFMFTIKPEQTFLYEGFHVDMFHCLANHFNFTLGFNPFFWKPNQFLFETKTIDASARLNILEFYHHGIGTVRYFTTYPYVYYDNFLAVPPGEDYSGYEKLIFPFDIPTWLLIVITFLAAYVTIFFVNLSTLTIKHFVFGKNVSTPSLNVAVIFSGSSLTTLPTKNFSRFLVISFVIYSLIIRTAWQSKMYELMQKVSFEI